MKLKQKLLIAMLCMTLLLASGATVFGATQTVTHYFVPTEWGDEYFATITNVISIEEMEPYTGGDYQEFFLSHTYITDGSTVLTFDGTASADCIRVESVEAPEGTDLVAAGYILTDLPTEDNYFKKGSTLTLLKPGTYDVKAWDSSEGADVYAARIIVGGKAGSSSATAPASVSAPASVAAPAPVFDVNAKYIATADVNVRSGAKAESAAIGYIPRGSAVQVLEAPNKWWYKVQFGEKTGFVSALYVVEQGSMDTANTTAKTVNTTALNVRSGAGVSNDIIGVMKSGETVYVIETTGGWAKIAWYGGTAYVANSYLK